MCKHFCSQPVLCCHLRTHGPDAPPQHLHVYGLVGHPMACTATLQTRLLVNLEAVSVFPKEHKEMVDVLCSLTASPEEMLSHHASTVQRLHDTDWDWGAALVAPVDACCTLEITLQSSYEQGKAATARFAEEQLFLLDGEGGIVIGMACNMDGSSFNNQCKSSRVVMFGEYGSVFAS